MVPRWPFVLGRLVTPNLGSDVGWCWLIDTRSMPSFAGPIPDPRGTSSNSGRTYEFWEIRAPCLVLVTAIRRVHGGARSDLAKRLCLTLAPRPRAYCKSTLLSTPRPYVGAIGAGGFVTSYIVAGFLLRLMLRDCRRFHAARHRVGGCGRYPGRP